MSYTIPIGPYHPALEEPYKLTLTCEGESVVDAALQIGFNFRGVEWLAQRKNYVQDVALVERVCGICSNVHTLTFCSAVERLAGIEVPARARYIRVVVAELERLHSHILWAGVAADGAILRQGIDLMEFTADGAAIRRVVGFFGAYRLTQ